MNGRSRIACLALAGVLAFLLEYREMRALGLEPTSFWIMGKSPLSREGLREDSLRRRFVEPFSCRKAHTEPTFLSNLVWPQSQSDWMAAMYARRAACHPWKSRAQTLAAMAERSAEQSARYHGSPDHDLEAEARLASIRTLRKRLALKKRPFRNILSVPRLAPAFALPALSPPELVPRTYGASYGQ